jgi:hypothetical protein
MFYRIDPVFKTWNTVEQFCHSKVKIADSRLRSYFIDAMSPENIRYVQKNNLIAVTNSIVSSTYGNINSIVRVNDSFYGVYYHPYQIYHHFPSKDFNCFINRMDVFRQSWLYQLIRRKLFDQGYVSFNMDITRMPANQGLTQIEAFEKQYQEYNSIFKKEHQQIKHQVPYKNFKDTGDLTNIVLDSKFSIILETYFDNNNVVTFSEKIFRCLQLPRPWILFSHQHAVSHLRKMGFDLLDDIVDHYKYDSIENAVERQVVILDIIEQLVSINIDSCQQRLIAAAQHNQSILKQFAETWKDDFSNTINIALKKLHD